MINLSRCVTRPGGPAPTGAPPRPGATENHADIMDPGLDQSSPHPVPVSFMPTWTGLLVMAALSAPPGPPPRQVTPRAGPTGPGIRAHPATRPQRPPLVSAPAAPAPASSAGPPARGPRPGPGPAAGSAARPMLSGRDRGAARARAPSAGARLARAHHAGCGPRSALSGRLHLRPQASPAPRATPRQPAAVPPATGAGRRQTGPRTRSRSSPPTAEGLFRSCLPGPQRGALSAGLR